MKNLFQPLLIIGFLMSSLLCSAQVPNYSSYPSASATIFLDFDGHLVKGTTWNFGGTIQCAPANLTTEQITEIFNRVAEDYRPFNINITTDSTKYWAAPAFQRTRIILTTTSEWYGAAGGVSFIGSFVWGDQTPAFVFTALLGYNQKRIAEAASHEAGHTLGLKHQSSYDANCAKTAEYNRGTGSGEIGWAPIMGVGYYRNMTLWNNGSDPYGCNSYQDDLSVITSFFNGFGYRTDDHGNQSDAQASTASFTNNQFKINGVIERMSDKDVFKFTLPVAGNFHVDASPYNIGTGNSGSNLDLQVDLMNSNGVVTSSYNPVEALGLSIDTSLTPGVYYLRVQGKGNIYAPQYASLGSYSLNSSFTPATALPLRKLQLEGVADNKIHRLNWLIDADEAVVRQRVEVSSDGRNFSLLASLGSDERMYQHLPAAPGSLLYRVNVLFDNGKEYYSNTIALKNAAGASRPKLSTNLITNTLSVTGGNALEYAISDYSGRMVAKGKLMQSASVINTQPLSAGMYIIRFYNGGEQYIEKFMKQ